MRHSTQEREEHSLEDLQRALDIEQTMNELESQLYDLIHQYAAPALTLAPENANAYYWLILSFQKQRMDEMASGELVAAQQKLSESDYTELLRRLQLAK